MKLLRTNQFRVEGQKRRCILLMPFVITLLMVLSFGVLTPNDAEAASCGKGRIQVEALPTDFVSGIFKGKALRGQGLMCVKKSQQGSRPVVSGSRENSTIVKTYNCGSKVVAYDGNNPDGTGFHKRWFVQTFNGSSNNGKKTLYCISRSMLNQNLSAGGKKVGAGNTANNVSTTFSEGFHKYRFVPQYTAGEECSAALTPVRYQHTACTANRYFTTYRDAGGDIVNPK